MRTRIVISIACKYCGVVFEALKSQHRVFCSKPCVDKWQSENLVGEKALHWRGGKVERKCPVCGKTIFVTRARARRSQNNFCSRECLGKWKSKLYQLNPKPSTKVARKCAQCGKEFYIHPCAIKHGEGKCCSRKCLGEWCSAHRVGENAAHWNGGGVTKECLQCHKQFTVKKARAEDGRGKFCSKSCFHEWRRQNDLRGPSHPLWVDDKQEYPYAWDADFIQPAIRDRDGCKCFVCGKPEQDKAHAVHHINYNKHDMRPINLVTLCCSCHCKTSHNRKFWQPFFEAMMPTFTGAQG